MRAGQGFRGGVGGSLSSSGLSRPQVALLCGPPGLGKTTLAHVIARQAGYCVVELNARYVPGLPPVLTPPKPWWARGGAWSRGLGRWSSCFVRARWDAGWSCHRVASSCRPGGPVLGACAARDPDRSPDGPTSGLTGSSDDRSPEAFRTCIEAATQMESVLGAGGKPNCLVIDEIDGAPVVGLLGAPVGGQVGR